MKKIHLIQLILISIFITGVPSCEECNCCDLGDGPFYHDVRIVDFGVERIEKKIGPTQYELYQQEDTVNAKGDLALDLKSGYEEIANHENIKTEGLFLNSVYACSPVYEPRTDQKFVDLTITSTNDYDSNHPAGSDLIDLFVTRGESFGIDDPKISLTEYLRTNSEYFILRTPWLFLNKSPDRISTHSFKFELALSDTTFIFKTPEMILK